MGPVEEIDGRPEVLAFDPGVARILLSFLDLLP